MPNIETYENKLEAPHPDDSGAEAFQMMGRRVGQAYDQMGRDIGGAVAKVGGQYVQHQELVETTDFMAKASAYEVKTAQDLADAKNNGADPTDPQWMGKFMQEHTDGFAALGDGMVTDGGQKLAAEYAARYRENTGIRALDFQAGVVAKKVVNNYGTTADNYANLARADGSTADASIDSLRAAAAHLPADARDELLTKSIAGVRDSQAEGIVSRVEGSATVKPADIDAVKAALTDPNNHFIDQMTPGKFNTMLTRLENARATHGAVLTDQNLAAFDSVLTRVKTQGDVGGQAQALIDNFKSGAYGGTAAEINNKVVEMTQKLNEANGYFTATKDMQGASHDDVVSKISDLTAKIAAAGPADLPALQAEQAALIKMAKERDDAHAADPAGQVLGINSKGESTAGRPGEEANAGSQTVISAYTAFLQKPTPESFNAYAAATAAEQRRLYPNDPPHLVTKYMADQMAHQLAAVGTDEDGAARVTAIFQAQAGLAGGHWPQMAQELFHDKVLNDSQYVAASLYGRPGSLGIAQDLIRAGTLRDEKGLYNPATGVTEAKARTAAATALQPLAATLSHSAGGVDLITAYQTALTQLIQYRGIREQKDLTGEAGDLAQQMVSGDYTFHGTLRIPNGVDADSVKSATGSVLDGMTDGKFPNLIPPPSYTGLGTDAARERFAIDLQTHGHWVTNANETGATLIDGNNQQVYLNVNGKHQPLEMTWDQLKRYQGKTAADNANISYEGGVAHKIDPAIAAYTGGQ